MNKRPLSVTIISCLFIVAGAVGFAYHLTEFKAQGPFQSGIVGLCVVRLLAILSGVFMLRGCNWARWLLLVWIAYHVILSAFHSLSELVMQFALRAGGLFSPSPAGVRVFSRRESKPSTNAKIDDTPVAWPVRFSYH